MDRVRIKEREEHPHAGGFLAGMATVLVLGGRTAVLKGRPELLEY